MSEPQSQPVPENAHAGTVAVLITAVVAWLITLLGVYGFGDYGMALFIFNPLMMGALPALILGRKQSPTFQRSFGLGMAALGVYALGLLVFAMEGLICILMAAPIATGFVALGAVFGYAVVAPGPRDRLTITLLVLGMSPAVAFVEQGSEPELSSVVTAIEIDADPQTVWKHVVAFPQLAAPTELIFKAGIAYPTHAEMVGTGVGAVRHCHFTTGSFVEPITVWDEPHLLKFDVVEQPEPMKELSFWDVDAPHLHDYFVSKQGQFKLTALPNGRTLLEGTTWYYHNIRPAFYWKFWSDYIVHSIHTRVLTHIRDQAQAEAWERVPPALQN